METKVCTCCQRRLPLDAYHKNKISKDGHHWMCKECRSKELKEQRKQLKLLKAKLNNPTDMADNTTEMHKNLANFTPRELLAELKSRGYVWEKMFFRQFVDYNKI